MSYIIDTKANAFKMKEGENMNKKMQLSREKIDIFLANNLMTVTELAERYGCSRSRMNVILNSREVTPMCAGRLAKALRTDVTKIIE